LRPAKYDVVVTKGTKFDKTFTWRDADGNLRDLTNYSGAARFNTFGPEGEVDATVSMGGAAGTIRVQLSAAQTTSIDWELGEWYLNIQGGGDDPERLLHGAVTVND
jgi:hypothetical protein